MRENKNEDKQKRKALKGIEKFILNLKIKFSTI